MKYSAKTIVTVGMFTALLSVLSILAIPMPSGVPLTLQTFAVALCGYVLGAKRGGATVLIYIALGVVGVPVFSGMHGGISWLVGYTGGFLWGFLFLAIMCGIARGKKKLVYRIVISGAGLCICHVIGVLQFAVLSEVTIGAAFLTTSAPYLWKDTLFLVGAYAVAKRIKGIGIE